ncbi:CU044_2847 family protein [Anaerolinea sp.]|uniref:CU044_2847 family protein n=1 Tax=Anaerolinea sp. TaxID=1872519 RepID=UPI002ACE8A25|nr:CU044_2847 family protein [Anaerolinea sp.]
MKRIVAFPLEEGGEIYVEVEDETSGYEPLSRGAEEIRKAGKTFETALEQIRPIAQGILKKLRSLHEAPDEIEVEFGLSLNAEVGAVIASSGVEANYKVTLTWKKEESRLTATPGKNP